MFEGEEEDEDAALAADGQGQGSLFMPGSPHDNPHHSHIQGLGRGLGTVSAGGIHSPVTFSFGGPSPSFTGPGLGWPQQAASPSFDFGAYAPPPSSFPSHDANSSGNGAGLAHVPQNTIYDQPQLRGMGRGTHMARPAWMGKN